MNLAFVMVHVLLICKNCNGMYEYLNHTTYYYGTEGTPVSTGITNETTVTADYSSSYSNHVIELTPYEIEQYLNQDMTKQFLSQFPHEYQRDILRHQLKHCPYTRLCGFSLNVTTKLAPCCLECSCHISKCLKYKTCCPDILFTYINRIKPSSTIQDLSVFTEKKSRQKDCIPLHFSKTTTYNSFGAFGFSSCPAGMEKELQMKCSRTYHNADDIFELEDTFPVIHKETNELYRNKYCAFCYNVSVDDIQQLNSSLLCSENSYMTTVKEILHAIYNDGACNVTFAVESSKLQFCFTDKHDCNETGTFEEAACSIYKSPVYVNEISFQNIFCSFCNRILNVSLTCGMAVSERFSGYAFSGLMNVKPPNQDTVECGDYQLYDSLSGVCKNIWCSSITVLENGKCVDHVGKLRNVSYIAFIKMKPINSLNIFDAFVSMDRIVSFMAGILEDGKLCDFQSSIKTNVSLSTPDASVSYIGATVQYHVTESHDPNIVVKELFSLHNSMHSFLMNDTNQLLTLKFQLDDSIDDVARLTESFNASYSLQALSGNTQQMMTYSHEFPCHYHGFDLYVLELTTCPKVTVSKKDVPWKKFEDEIIFVDGNFRLTRFEYYFLDMGHIMICTDSYKEYLSVTSKSKKGSHLSAELITSISVITLSIIALCVTLFLYCFLSNLRQSVPGKNNVSLVTALLCAQCLYLISSFSELEEYSTICFVLGLFVHFSWLVALFWMNICTYHMFRVLTKTRVITSSSGMKRLILYHAYAFLMAAVFVSMNIVLSYISNGGYGYGGKACYITSQRMLILTFGIPATLIVLSNLTMFTVVVIKIKRSPSVQKNVKNERNDIVIFAKLSTITGATWIFGLLYMFTKSIVLSYIFIFLNASQGIFIMFSFVVNRRVFNLLREKVLGSDVVSSSSGQTTTRTM